MHTKVHKATLLLEGSHEDNFSQKDFSQIGTEFKKITDQGLEVTVIVKKNKMKKKN